MTTNHALEVRLYGTRVGTLGRTHRNRLVFQYEEGYVEGRNPPLSTCMPTRIDAYGPKPTEAWFEGLLAEGHRRKHLARIVGAASIDTWALLRAAGAECAGAVQIIAPEHRDSPGLFELDEELLARLLAEAPIEPLGTVHHAARISIAGAQEKLTLFRKPDGTWAVPIGGHPSSHILKPETELFPGLVENEHWCMEIARRAGLDAAKTKTEAVAGRKVLVVERYDRTTSTTGELQRVHQEDFAQALGRRHKYQAEGGPSTYELFEVRGADRNALFDRLMFAWLIGNCDAHAKNYSILEPGTANARLAPAYDMLSTEAYPDLAKTLGTAIGRAKTLDTVNRAAVEAMGQRIGFQSGEASQRLHELARRTQEAVESAKEDGMECGLVRTRNVLNRVETAQRRGPAVEA